MALRDTPRLEFVIEPESKHRFRYGNSDPGSHGVISGKTNQNGKKAFPTVQLINYGGSSSNISIKLSLCTEELTDHVHQIKQKKLSELKNCIEKTLNGDFCAVFDDLSIIIPGNKNMAHDLLMERKIKNHQDLSDSDKEKYEEEVKQEYREIIHSVKLRFEAFEKDSGIKICELYSDTITDGRVPCSNDLKICDMSKDFGSWKGGEDIILLCNKMKHKSNVKIKFFETDVWEEYISVEPSNIHHQVAIKFKTPPYKANVKKTVAVCLEQDDKMSELEYFTYMPEAPCDGELKICHISKLTGSCKGNEDVIILCEKVQEDDVKVKFFETDGIKNIWEEYASFSDIHHQVAIKFKTPEYKMNIEKTVYVRLEQGDKISGSVEFTYLPEDCPLKRKRYGPEETVDLLSNPMSIASTSCTSDGILGNILKEEESELHASLEVIFKNYENPSSSFMNYLLSDIDEESIEQSANELEEQVVNVSYPFSPDPDLMDGVMIDGKLAGKIAMISVEDPEFPPQIPEKVSVKESREKILKDKCENFENYLPFLSNRDSKGNTLLHLAVMYNKNIEKVLYLNKISKSSIINVKNDNKQTALHIAVEKNSDVVVQLVENMADPNIKNADGNNCYHIACQHDFAKTLMYMSGKEAYNGVGLNSFNKEGLTPLHIALKNYSPACLDFLLEKCPHRIDFCLVDTNLGKSFLHYAVEYSPTYVFPLLATKKIEINLKDIQGRTPLLIAHQKGNFDIVTQLLSAGAIPYKRIPQCSSSINKQASAKKREASTRQSCLNKAYIGPSYSDDSYESKESKMIFEELAENLSTVLDPDMKWVKLATYVFDEEYIASLEKWDPSPTRTILEYMKKHYGAKYIQHLFSLCCMIDDIKAMIITQEALSYTM